MKQGEVRTSRVTKEIRVIGTERGKDNVYGVTHFIVANSSFVGEKTGFTKRYGGSRSREERLVVVLVVVV